MYIESVIKIRDHYREQAEICFETADKIRDALREKGIELTDFPNRTEWIIKKKEKIK